MKQSSQTRPSAIVGVPSGCLGGATHACRSLGERVAHLLAAAGLPSDRPTTRLIVGFVYASALLSMVGGVLADPARIADAVPALRPWWPTVVLVLSTVAVGGFSSRTRERLGAHAGLLSTGRARAVGVLLGLSLLDLPLLVVLLAQSVRLPLVLVSVALGLAAAAPLVTLVPKPASALLLGAPVALAVGALLLHALSLGTAGADLWPALASAPVVVSGALVTGLLTHHLGRRRLAPRSRRAAVGAGMIVLGTFAVSFLVTSGVTSLGWAHLRPAVTLAAVFAGLLLLRTRLVHAMSVESRGYALFVLRDVPGAGRRLTRHYATNALLLLAPTVAVGAATLVLHGAASGVPLLLALFALELAGDAFVVQRHTVILPVGTLDRLGVLSRSGLAACGCLAAAVAATGVAGLTTTALFDDAWSVAVVSLLFAAAAAVVGLVTRLDADAWLRTLTLLPVEAPA